MTCPFGTARRAGMMLPPRGVFAPWTRWRPPSRPPSRGRGRWAGKWGAPQWPSYATLRARVIPTGRACPSGHHTRAVLSSTWSLGRSWAWPLSPSHSSAWSGHALFSYRSTFCASEARRREADGVAHRVTWRAPLIFNNLLFPCGSSRGVRSVSCAEAKRQRVPPCPRSQESRLNSHIGHIIVIQKITIKTRQEQLLTDAERYSIQFDSTHKRAVPDIALYNHEFANSPLPGSWCSAARAAESRKRACWPGTSGRNPRRFPRPDHTRMRIVDRTASPPLHVQYYDRPRRPTGARPRAGYGLRAGRDGVSLPRRLSRGSACVARRAAGAGPLFRVTAPTR